MELKLYDWQKEALQMSGDCDSLALFAEMGTGKTCAMIQILRRKFNANKRFMRTLILGPVSVVFNWEKEILKFSKIEEDRIHVSVGSGKSRVTKLEKFFHACKGKGIVTLNYEALRNKDLLFALKEWRPEILICDESHMVKNHKSKQSKNAYVLAKTALNRYLLTGTPILNSAVDIFMQYKIMDLGETFGGNFWGFQNYYFYDANASWKAKASGGYYPKWEAREELYDELNKKIYKKAIRVLKEDCLDLPPRIELVHDVALSTLQARMYKEMKRDFITFIKDNQDKPRAVVAQLALNKAMKLQQITSGFVKTEDGVTVDLGDIPRIKELEELINQVRGKHKFIVWTHFRFSVKLISKLLNKMGIKFVLITGDQSTRQKQDSVDAFETDKTVRCVLANRKAGGTGINLIEASYSFVYERGFSLAEENQSMDRNHRSGSERHEKIVKVDLCARGTMDEITLEALKMKQKISDKIIDLAEEL